MDNQIREEVLKNFGGQFPVLCGVENDVEYVGDALAKLAVRIGLSEKDANQYAKQVMTYATNWLRKVSGDIERADSLGYKRI